MNFILSLFFVFFACGQAWAFQNTCDDLLSIASFDDFGLNPIPNAEYAHAHPEKAYFKVTKVKGLQHTYLAVFNHSVYMNWALGRMATFQTQGRIISDQGLSQKNTVIQSYAGHDLPAEVINEYMEALRLQSFKKYNTAPVLFESAFHKNVIQAILASDPEAIFIAASLNFHPEKIISHEMLHAQFYERRDLQMKIAKFWSEKVTPEDRQLYLEVLKREGYDVKNSEQVLNEFFAYTLEKGRPIIFPPSLILRYRKPLTEYLEIP